MQSVLCQKMPVIVQLLHPVLVITELWHLIKILLRLLTTVYTVSEMMIALNPRLEDHHEKKNNDRFQRQTKKVSTGE